MLKIRFIIPLLLTIFLYAQHDHEHGDGGEKWKPVGFVRGTVVDDLTDLPKEYASISIIVKESDSDNHDEHEEDDHEGHDHGEHEEGDRERHNHEEHEAHEIIAGGISDADGKFLISDVLSVATENFTFLL